MADRVVLALDVGGSHVKMLTSEAGAESRRFDSGPDLTASEMVRGALASTAGWSYDVVSVGVPSPVRAGEILAEPVNLGGGWVGFDFGAAFGKPTRVVNNARLGANNNAFTGAFRLWDEVPAETA